MDPRLVAATRTRSGLDGVSARVQAVCGDLAAIDPQPVDVVLSSAVLHHLPDRLPETMRLFRRWLKPGGVFIAIEPVASMPWLDWLRRHSGVPDSPLDPGERKLTRADLRLIEREFAGSQRVYFRILGRFGRLSPRLNPLFLRLDALLRSLPGASWLSGAVVLVCRSDA